MSNNIFDPFRDFETRGYLRNSLNEKNLVLVKEAEQDLFQANLPQAFHYLSLCDVLGYHDFLKVHEILFSDLYPWAGQDRSITAPNAAIS